MDRLDNPARGVKQFASSGARGIDRENVRSVSSRSWEDEHPIFVISAGWRTGSTLLQRLILSGESVLLWGEPYDRCAVVRGMTQSLAPFDDTWPPPKYATPVDMNDDLTSTWVANLYPAPSALLDAYRNLLLTLFAEPAYEAGAKRWGFKVVRFGYAEAIFLRTLFPEATFLYLQRTIEDAYSSYKQFSSAMDWYGRWPNEPVFTPYQFGRFVRRLQNELPYAAEETGGMMIDYDDLVSGVVSVDEISRHCKLELDPDVLEAKVGSRRTNGNGTSRLDRMLLRMGRKSADRSFSSKSLRSQ